MTSTPRESPLALAATLAGDAQHPDRRDDEQRRDQRVIEKRATEIAAQAAITLRVELHPTHG